MFKELNLSASSLPPLLSAVRRAATLDPLARGLGAPVRQTLVIARELEQNASVRSRMGTALRILDRMEAADYIPESFGDAILHGCAQQGISIAQLARDCKIAVGTVSDWTRGATPDRIRSHGAVKRIEKRFGFPDGSLRKRMKFNFCGGGCIPNKYVPEGIPTNEETKAELAARVPEDILTRPAAEIKDLLRKAYADYLVHREKHVDAHHALLIKLPYRHKCKQWTKLLIDDVVELFGFHRDDVEINYDGAPGATDWSYGYCERVAGEIEQALGAILKLHAEDFVPADGTLGLFMVPRLVWESIEFVRKRRKDKKHGKVDIELLVMAKEMVKVDGFLHQHDDYRERLPAAALETLKKDFPEQFHDWTALCAAVEAKYESLIAEVARKMKRFGHTIGRAKMKLLPILTTNSYDFVETTDRIVARQYDECGGGPALVFATRKLILQEFRNQLAHRSRTMRDLTWFPDNTGSVRFVDGRWEVHCHRDDFKGGARSEYFRDNPWAVVTLEDVNGLYQAIEGYLRPGGAREWLLDRRDSKRFFVKRSKKPEYDAIAFHDVVARDTRSILRTEPDGPYAEVHKMGPHASRKIIYNALKTTKGHKVAAETLLITEAVADSHYNYADATQRLAHAPKERRRQYQRRRLN
jgi:transcriptional regulator with XRE-family HTH domain